MRNSNDNPSAMDTLEVRDKMGHLIPHHISSASSLPHTGSTIPIPTNDPEQPLIDSTLPPSFAASPRKPSIPANNCKQSGIESSLPLATICPENLSPLADNESVDEEEDTSLDESDSAFGGSYIGCDTETLASYVTDYRYENGRRYHAYCDGEYWGPNDEHANEQQDFAHHMYLMTLEGRLHAAPLVNPHRILDIGTGTGIWAIEIADAYPSASVIGTDLSPIQPLFVPPNCAFEIEDLNLSWTFPPNHFDFIHIRELFGCVTNWDTFFAEAFEHLQPGGYVEILEHSVWPVADDDTVNKDSFFTLWGKTVVGLGEKFGKPFTIWEESKDRMEKAGFVDIVEERYKWPMNGWPSPHHRTHGNDGNKSWKILRELGLWNQFRLHDGVEGFMIRLLTTVGGWSYESAQVFLAQMRAALKDLKVHAYLDVSVVYGRKPGGRQVLQTDSSLAPLSSLEHTTPPYDHTTSRLTPST